MELPAVPRSYVPGQTGALGNVMSLPPVGGGDHDITTVSTNPGMTTCMNTGLLALDGASKGSRLATVKKTLDTCPKTGELYSVHTLCKAPCLWQRRFAERNTLVKLLETWGGVYH